MGHVKIRQFGNVIETYEYEKDIPPRRYNKKAGQTGYGKRHLIPTKRRADNLYRARAAFTRLVRSNTDGLGSPTLLTLTIAQIGLIGTAYSFLTGFVRRLRTSLGSEFAYIAVPEFQKRGAVHFHMLVWGLPDKLIENERNSRALQNAWGRGFLDCIPTDGSPKLAGYLSKYMSKAMSDDRIMGKKAYVCSRNVLRPVQTSSRTAFDHLEHIVGVDSVPCHIRTFGTQWLGRGIYKRFILTNDNDGQIEVASGSSRIQRGAVCE